MSDHYFVAQRTIFFFFIGINTLPPNARRCGSRSRFGNLSILRSLSPANFRHLDLVSGGGLRGGLLGWVLGRQAIEVTGLNMRIWWQC